MFCVGVPYITRFLSGSFFLRPSPSTLPSMRAVSLSPPCFFQLSMFGRGLRCFDFANQMPFSIILLVGCCFTCDVSLLSLSFSVFLSLSFSLFFSLSLSVSLSLLRSLSLSPLLCPSLSLSVCLCLCRRCCKKS